MMTKNFLFVLCVCGNLGISFARAQGPISVDQIRADLAQYVGREGALTATEDGKPANTALMDADCKSYQKIFSDYQTLLLQPSRFVDLPFRFLDEDHPERVATRAQNADSVVYANRFDTHTGVLIDCGAEGHMSHGIHSRKNFLTLTPNSIEIKVTYSCSIFSPRSGQHSVVWSCAFDPNQNPLPAPAPARQAKLLTTLDLPAYTLDGEDLFARLTPDSHGVLGMKDNFTAQIVDWKSGRTVREFSPSTREAISAIAMTPAGDRVLVATMQFGLFMFDAASGRQIATVRQSACQFCWRTSISFSQDGSRVLTSGGERSPLDVFNTLDLSPVATVSDDHNYGLFSSRLSPDGGEILTPNFDAVKIWGVSSQSLSRSFSAQAVAHTVFSPNGKELLLGSYKQGATVIHAKNGTTRLDLRGHSNAVTALAYSGDGNWIATGSDDGTVRVWDAASGELARFAPSQNAREVKHVELSDDGSILLVVAATPQMKIQIWSTQTGPFIR